jgi:glycosyltransferase involved in cell wall biosynthesis
MDHRAMSRRPIRILELRSVVGAGGGPEKTILNGAHLADPARFAVTVCYLRAARDAKCDIASRAAALNLDYVEIEEESSFDPTVWTALRRLACERRIDIVHAHDYKTDLLALLLARAEGVIPVTTAHGWTGHSWRERRLYYPVDKQLIRRFKFVIAVSDQIKSDLVRAGVASSRIRVVLNGIDPAAFRRDRAQEASARQALGVSPNEIVVVAAGRLESQKRFDLLIEACAVLRRRHPGLRLLIAGEGSLRRELEALANRDLPGACTLLGHCGDIRPLHHAANLFVQSSDYEGTPNSVLEAMALETPIVATAAGGTAQVAVHGIHALIVPPGDVPSLASAMDRAIVDEVATRERVARARRSVKGALSFANRMAAVEDLYEEAVAASGLRPAVSVAGQCA